MRRKSGWYGQSARHSLAARGMKTSCPKAQRQYTPYHGPATREDEWEEEFRKYSLFRDRLMYAGGILSDAQEAIDRGDIRVAYDLINKAKHHIFTAMDETRDILYDKNLTDEQKVKKLKH